MEERLAGGREAPALHPRRSKANEIAAEESLEGPKSNLPLSPKSHSTPTIARPLMTTRAPCHLWTHCPTIPGDEAPEEGGHIDNSQKEHVFQVLKIKLKQQDLLTDKEGNSAFSYVCGFGLQVVTDCKGI